MLKNGVPFVGLAYAERYFLNYVETASFSTSTSVSTVLSVVMTIFKPIADPVTNAPTIALNTFNVTNAYGFVGLVNVVGGCMLLMTFGKYCREPVSIR